MGLDASAYAVKGEERVWFFYWRKHYDLNALMFGFKIPEDDPMAWVTHESIPVIGHSAQEIGAEELDTIEYFTQYFDYDHRNSRDKDLEFVREARDFIEKGWVIKYESC